MHQGARDTCGLAWLSATQGEIHLTHCTNDGDIAVTWALDGHGILMRAEWDIAKYLRSGRLQQVLKNYRTPPADIYAVYPQRHQLARRVRVFVDFLCQSFERKSIIQTV